MSAIHLQQVSKAYHLYNRPIERLKEMLTGRPAHVTIQALQLIDLDIPEGQVLGLIGNNGAGKSTFLKLVTGTIQATTGEIHSQGRIAAILELGTGFHPEMTGRENVYMAGMVMGMSRKEISARFADIVKFSGINAFIEHPVKTYSSGMMMRLAFAVATSGDPDILVIDEALSVGDGAFARKSFERIMQFREQGKTILFCSHSLYQVESICDRAIWLDQGAVRADGDTAEVIAAYNAFLSAAVLKPDGAAASPSGRGASMHINVLSQQDPQTFAKLDHADVRLLDIHLRADQGPWQRAVSVKTGKSDLSIRVRFYSALQLAIPTVAFMFINNAGLVVSSMSTLNDKLEPTRDAKGFSMLTLKIPAIALLKGNYSVNVYLLCERGIHVYDKALSAGGLMISQTGLEQGVFTMARSWTFHKAC